MLTTEQIDRKKDFYFIEGLHFPHWDAAKRQGPDRLLSNTVLDGELVIDIDPATGEVSAHSLRLRASGLGTP